MKGKTKVAIVVPYFGNGGAEHMVSRLVSNFDLSRIQSEVICVFGKKQNNELEAVIETRGIPIIYIGKGLGFSPKAVRDVFKQLSLFKPNIVHTHLSACIYVFPWVLCHRVKMLHTVHNMPQFEMGKRKQLVMRLMYALGKAIPVAISEEIRKLILDYYYVKEKVELIYNPVDIDRFANRVVEKNSEFTWVTIGRLSIQKNQKLLLEAFAKFNKKYPASCLYIVGDGELKEYLMQWCHELKLDNRVMFTGNVTNVEDILLRSHAFVLSSSYEGLPLVLLEAMASGLPIVSTNVGGVSDIVTNNGLLSDNGNADELFTCMCRLYEDKALYEKCVDNAKKNVMQFDVSKIAALYEELYEKYSTD